MSGTLPNTLLVQRLDAVLGITLAKYSGIARSNAAFDALVEPGQVAPVNAPNPRREQTAASQTNTPNRATVDAGDDSRLRTADASARLFPSSPTSLGMAARTVLGLLQRYPEAPQPLALRLPLASHGLLQSASTSARPASAPLPPFATPGAIGQTGLIAALDASNNAIAQLARTLALRVNASGMFYESHLARVAFEGLPARSLRDHPQAQGTSAGPGAHNTRQPASAALPQRMGSRDATPSSSSTSTAALPSLPAPADELLPEHATLVRQQLEVLATQQWNARAEAWPGVPMAWQIARASQDTQYPAADPDGHQSRAKEADEANAPWQSRLTLVLPKLGTVEAHLHLHAQGCSLRIDCGDSHPALAQQTEALRQQFAASGLRLTDLKITRAQPPFPSSASDGPGDADLDPWGPT